MELRSFFNQYLRTSQIPIFKYYKEKGKLVYRWDETLEEFSMPIDLKINNKLIRLIPTNSWQSYVMEHDIDVVIEIDPNYYIEVNQVR